MTKTLPDSTQSVKQKVRKISTFQQAATCFSQGPQRAIRLFNACQPAPSEYGKVPRVDNAIRRLEHLATGVVIALPDLVRPGPRKNRKIKEVHKPVGLQVRQHHKRRPTMTLCRSLGRRAS